MQAQEAILHAAQCKNILHAAQPSDPSMVPPIPSTKVPLPTQEAAAQPTVPLVQAQEATLVQALEAPLVQAKEATLVQAQEATLVPAQAATQEAAAQGTPPVPEDAPPTAHVVDASAAKKAKNRKKALLTKNRKKVKTVAKEVLHYLVKEGILRKVSFQNINTLHLSALAVQMVPFFLGRFPSSLAWREDESWRDEEFLGSLIDRLLSSHSDKKAGPSPEPAPVAPVHASKSRVILTMKDVWGAIHQAPNSITGDEILKELPNVGDNIEEYSEGAIHPGKVKSIDTDKGTFAVQWYVGGLITKKMTLKKNKIRLVKEEAPCLGDDTIHGWMFMKNVAVITPENGWTLLNINEFPRNQQQLPIGVVYDHPANVDHLFAIEKGKKKETASLEAGQYLKLEAGDSLVAKKKVSEASDTGLEFGGVVCGEVDDPRASKSVSNDSQMTISAVHMFMMHSIDAKGTPYQEIHVGYLSPVVAYHLLHDDGQVVRSSRVLANPDRNARLDMKTNPDQASIFMVNKGCMVIILNQIQSIQMVVHRVVIGSSLIDPFAPLWEVQKSCKDKYKKEVRNIHDDQLNSSQKQFTKKAVEEMMQGLQTNWMDLPEIKLMSGVDNLATKVNDMTVKVQFQGMDLQNALQRQWKVYQLTGKEAVKNVEAITSAAQFMHANQQWLLMIPWAPFMATKIIQPNQPVSLEYGFNEYWNGWGAVRRNIHGIAYKNPPKNEPKQKMTSRKHNIHPASIKKCGTKRPSSSQEAWKTVANFKKFITIPSEVELLYHYIMMHADSVFSRGYVQWYDGDADPAEFGVQWDDGSTSTLNVVQCHVGMHEDQTTPTTWQAEHGLKKSKKKARKKRKRSGVKKN